MLMEYRSGRIVCRPVRSYGLLGSNIMSFGCRKLSDAREQLRLKEPAKLADGNEVSIVRIANPEIPGCPNGAERAHPQGS